jgi:hypothetical protein
LMAVFAVRFILCPLLDQCLFHDSTVRRLTELQNASGYVHSFHIHWQSKIQVYEATCTWNPSRKANHACLR